MSSAGDMIALQRHALNMSSAIVAEISRHDLEELKKPNEAFITDCEHLCSYNWKKDVVPTIIVPGVPSLWVPFGGSRQLKKDSGLVYIDQNADRHPSCPLEPLFRALYLTNPHFEIGSINVVTDRNNIRKLLGFVKPESTRNGLEPFTIYVEMSKNTALFYRQEPSTREVIKAHEFRGYGHEFEKAYTKSGISDSSGHHRIVSYCFGGLSFVIRHETDGYINKEMSSHKTTPDKDNLTALLDSLSLSSPPAPIRATTKSDSGLVVEREGNAIPLGSTLEIKTRVAHKPIPFEDVAPQLWVSQTPNLVRAYHVKGRFREAEVENISEKLAEWEKDNQNHLRMLSALVAEIIKRVKDCGGRAVLKYDVMKDKIILSQVKDGEKMLPQDLRSKWEEKEPNTPRNVSKPVQLQPKAGAGVTVTETSLSDDGIHV